MKKLQLMIMPVVQDCVCRIFTHSPLKNRGLDGSAVLGKTSGLNLPLLQPALLILTSLSLLSCGKPRFIPVQPEEPPPIYTEGVNFQRQNYLAVEIDTPLFIEKTESINGTPLETFVIADNWLLVTTRHGFLYRMQASDLKKQRKTRIGKGLAAAPTYQSGFFYLPLAVDKSGLVAYDFSRGKISWSLKGFLSESSPLLSGSLLIHASRDGQIIGLDRRNGKEIWKSVTGGGVTSSLALHNNRAIAVTQNGALRCLSPDSGTIIWQRDLNEATFAAPLILSESVYLATYGGNVYRIGLDDGRLIARRKLSAPVYTSLSASENAIFVSGSDGHLRKLDATSLEERWSVQLDGALIIPCLVTPQWLFAAGAHNSLYVISNDSGQIAQILELPGRVCSVPLIFKGNLIVGYEYDGLALLKSAKSSMAESH
jgi:outer membrane protein assembly factor BamB